MRSVVLDLLRNIDSASAAGSTQEIRQTQSGQEDEMSADGLSDGVGELDPADLDELISTEVFCLLP